MENIDVAIIGGGPAGLQAALVLARTRKNVVVFDAPAPPRNGPSHGVHNFVGLDGLLPQSRSARCSGLRRSSRLRSSPASWTRSAGYRVGERWRDGSHDDRGRVVRRCWPGTLGDVAVTSPKDTAKFHAEYDIHTDDRIRLFRAVVDVRR